MTREGALLVVVAVTVLLLAVLAWAWWRRTRRDAVWSAPVGEIPADARETALFETLYVATTRHGEPLERLAIGGLAFRSRAALTVTDAGFALDLTGEPRLFFAAARLDDIAQATVAIDRVVERDGLVRVTWRIDDETLVDSYFRPQDASARALADALRGILPIPTGSDA
ncbi:hypothetical protein [Microbacterium thalassium]|uniref:PH domain-containing protein n=1 Tax=Microbacterium thalassium TaxID=362649 RepID=A0A7X0KV54_9MICO|nr:hypothetical protein [Microbacterium thalassium]MBB6391875.1 hypothetical protein [Microbacterium thalassium]GLK23895.1 hypothetical protein GCM10017607_12130 [Microbacterium thalassium]